MTARSCAGAAVALGRDRYGVVERRHDAHLCCDARAARTVATLKRLPDSSRDCQGIERAHELAMLAPVSSIYGLAQCCAPPRRLAGFNVGGECESEKVTSCRDFWWGRIQWTNSLASTTHLTHVATARDRQMTHYVTSNFISDILEEAFRCCNLPELSANNSQYSRSALHRDRKGIHRGAMFLFEHRC